MRELHDQALLRLADVDPAATLTADPRSEPARAVLAGAVARAGATGIAGRPRPHVRPSRLGVAVVLAATVAIVALAFATRVQGGAPSRAATYAFTRAGLWPRHGRGVSPGGRRGVATPRHQIRTAPPVTATPTPPAPAPPVDVAPSVPATPPQPLIAMMSPGVGVTANSGATAGAGAEASPPALAVAPPRHHRRTRRVRHH